ncbi:hypothetical protein QCN29_06245 [Streptomyces sp. HNM0663]|uniref:RNA polymerase sigma factor 70 region 4 type 2 domain-containing protein n=1 Tax=Streptomyces chengmaiensis TaxID=3040919 RepID=A0ABT6HI08_9ACTN|nr:hypothetical protein [Streptomyces chengmaiensis]MDH2388391.1 hypothetical protein [Streptomyces chengmaiensis]
MAANDAELDREAEKVYRLFKKGVNRLQLSRRLGMSYEVVNRRLARARKNLGGDAMADMRTDTESSLDDLIRESHRNLQNAETVMERNSIIRTIADLKMRKAKLLGLEQPAKLTLEMENAAMELLHTQPDPVWGDGGR